MSSGLRGEFPIAGPVELAELIVSSAEQRGIRVDAEGLRVALTSLRFLGRRYKITRSERLDTVDCSTLVSQSLWEGAGIAVPFTAEAQRLFPVAKHVSEEELFPGDAIFGYPSLAASADGRHNHVALFLGWDHEAHPWGIESSSPAGVAVRPLAALPTAGGFRRFTPYPRRSFGDGDWVAVAQAVPKLGRLGARLTAGGGRERHPGIDVYARTGTEVRAPIGGGIIPGPGLLRISDGTATCVLGNVSVGDVRENVARGEVIGVVAERARGRCNRIPSLGSSWLHVELWSTSDLGFPAHPDPDVAVRAPRSAGSPYNPVYAMKLGLITAPVSLGLTI